LEVLRNVGNVLVVCADFLAEKVITTKVLFAVINNNMRVNGVKIDSAGKVKTA
jgi:hypothetical protein